MSTAQRRYVSPVGRVSFPSVYKATPGLNESSLPKFRVTLIFPPDTDLSEMKRAIQNAVKAKWGDRVPKKLDLPIRDAGDKTHVAGYIEGQSYAAFSSKYKPGVIDASKEPILEETNRFYAGCYARVSYFPLAYTVVDKSGAIIKQGVMLGLQNIQKVRDGEPFGGFRGDAEDDFDEITTDIDDVDHTAW